MAGKAPVPLTEKLSEPPAELSLTLRLLLREPDAPGVKETVTVHVAPAATELPQVLVWAKSPGLPPEKLIPEMVSCTRPALVRVTVWPGLVVPTSWLVK